MALMPWPEFFSLYNDVLQNFRNFFKTIVLSDNRNPHTFYIVVNTARNKCPWLEMRKRRAHRMWWSAGAEECNLVKALCYSTLYLIVSTISTLLLLSVTKIVVCEWIKFWLTYIMHDWHHEPYNGFYCYFCRLAELSPATKNIYIHKFIQLVSNHPCKYLLNYCPMQKSLLLVKLMLK